MRGRGRGAPRGSRYPSRWSWRTSSLEWRNSTARSTMDANCIGTTSCPMEWSVRHLPFSHLFVALFYDFCSTGSFYGAFLAIFCFVVAPFLLELCFSHGSSFFVASDIHCYRNIPSPPLSLPPDSVPEPDREV